MAQLDTTKLLEEAKSELKDASRFLFFDDSGSVLASSFSVNAAELKPLAAAVTGDRDDVIRQGMTLQGTRFEVHRHHPPLVYGRTMGGAPESSEGVAVCRVANGPDGKAVYGLITYQMPNVSARMVPILQKFCNEYLAAK